MATIVTWLFPDVGKNIKGEVYEFRQLIGILPVFKKWREYAKFLGFKTVSVKYVIYSLTFPPRIIKLIREDDDLKQIFYGFVFDSIKNKKNWKEPTEGALETEDWQTALLLADAITHFVGGSWIISSKNHFYIWSKGYYEYVGA